MKHFLFVLGLLICFANSAFAKLEFQISDCTVHSVVATETKIVFTVSGTCRFLLAQKSSPQGNANEVNSEIDHGIIVIKRDGQKPDVWKKLSEQAQAVSSKRIWIDCFGITAQFENYQINYISCTNADFGELKKPSNKTLQ
jgi:hypothetical protein